MLALVAAAVAANAAPSYLPSNASCLKGTPGVVTVQSLQTAVQSGPQTHVILDARRRACRIVHISGVATKTG